MKPSWAGFARQFTTNTYGEIVTGVKAQHTVSSTFAETDDSKLEVNSQNLINTGQSIRELVDLKAGRSMLAFDSHTFWHFSLMIDRGISLGEEAKKVR